MYKSGEYWKFNPINLHKVHFQQRYFWKFPYFCISPQKPSYAHLFHLRRKNYVIISWMSGHTLFKFWRFFQIFFKYVKYLSLFQMFAILDDAAVVWDKNWLFIVQYWYYTHFWPILKKSSDFYIGIYGITLSELSRIKSILLY